MRKREVNEHEWLTVYLSDGFKPTARSAVDISRQKITRVRDERSLYYSLLKVSKMAENKHISQGHPVGL